MAGNRRITAAILKSAMRHGGGQNVSSLALGLKSVQNPPPMLTSSPTKHGAGITLYGDFLDLDTLYNTIHKIAEEGFAEEHTRNFILGLAYDIRKAKEKKRETKKLGIPKEETAKYKGVAILWPHFIPQVAMLRHYAGYRTTDHRDQACLYLLEDCVITSLLAFDPVVGKTCVEFLLRFPGFPHDHLFEYCDGCSGDTLRFQARGGSTNRPSC